MASIRDYNTINSFTFRIDDKKFSDVRLRVLRVFNDIFSDLGIGHQDNVNNLILIDHYDWNLHRECTLDSAGFPIQITYTWDNKKVVEITISRDFTIEDEKVTEIDIDYLNIEFDHIIEYAAYTGDDFNEWYEPGRMLLDIHDGELEEYVSYHS